MNETFNEYYEQKTNKIVAVILPISVGIIGLMYLCLKNKCKKHEDTNESIHSIEPVIQRV